jgi:fucose 4-O-acetylase-like acetyltransferase
MSTIQAYLGIYICLNLSYIFSKLKFLGKILAYIGSGSLFILIFHNFIQANSFKIAAEYFANEYTAGIFSFLISTSLPLAFLAATKKNEIMSTLLLPKAKHPVLRQAPEI